VKARPPFPGLSTVLCDPAGPPPAPEPAARADDLRRRLDPPAIQRMPVQAEEKRIHLRFDKAFVVTIGSELFGDTHAIARNVSAGGILVEMCYAPPLGTVVTVHFRNERQDGAVDEIVARAEVKHHHYLNFTGGTEGDTESDSARAVGLRFIEFIDLPGADPGGLLH
jgi:hypothetical protein